MPSGIMPPSFLKSPDVNKVMHAAEPPTYLDHNATTPLHPRVVACIENCMLTHWHNPSAAYAASYDAGSDIARARRQLAFALGLISETDIDNVACETETSDMFKSIIFTSGGSESNNWAVDFCVRRSTADKKSSCHIITTTVEHDSIKNKLLYGTDHYAVPVEVTYISPSSINCSSSTLPGVFDADDFINAVRPNTSLISCILAQNETGIIQPLADIAEKLRQVNIVREANNLPRVLLHTDASQALGKVSLMPYISSAGINVGAGGVDMLTVCGHKFEGPRIGALYLNPVTVPHAQVHPFIFGGGQEFGLRAGTQNTPMIVGLGEAAYLASRNVAERAQNMRSMRNLLAAQLTVLLDDDGVKFNFNPTAYGDLLMLPNTLSVAFPTLAEQHTTTCNARVWPARELQQRLAARGVLCSTGSACHAAATAAAAAGSQVSSCSSSVLVASGISNESQLSTTLRLSVGTTTTADEVVKAAQIIFEEVSAMRSDRKES